MVLSPVRATRTLRQTLCRLTHGLSLQTFDAAELAKQGIRGGYDGMKMDKQGNIWTTGPGGILIISPAGKLLGRIETGNPNSNVNFGEDGSTLFITSKMNLLRVKTKTKGLK